MAGRYHSIPTFLDKVNPFSASSSTIQTYISSHEYVQRLQNVAYGTFLGLILCLSWNLMAVAVLWSQGGEVEQESLFLAVAYLVLGVPAAYSSWHRTLSLAFQEKKRLTFKWFLVFYLFHLAFCLFASISPIEGRSLTGVLSAMAVSSDHGFARVLYFVGFVLFSYEYALSFWVMLSVYMYYRHGGVSLGDDLTSMEP